MDNLNKIIKRMREVIYHTEDISEEEMLYVKRIEQCLHNINKDAGLRKHEYVRNSK